MTGAIVAAAGAGRRVGGGTPKQFLPVAGKPMLVWSIEALASCTDVDRVVVALPTDAVPAWKDRLKAVSSKVHTVVAGGSDRQESVRGALRALDDDVEYVLVHDGARPLLTGDLARRVLAAAVSHGAATAALPVSDTLRRSAGEGALATETIDRSGLWAVQTPQAFRLRLLVEAHDEAARSGVRGTDDASLVERLGHPVRLVPGSPRNIKVTGPEDVGLAGVLLAEGVSPVRVGIGYDVHRLVAGRPLVLGGLHVPFDRGLLGHSDADVLLHAVMDALLGAAALGDIGRHFPDTDPRFAGVSSLALLYDVVGQIAAAGWAAANIDAVVVAERPKLAPYVPQMIANIADALGIPVEAVNIKATTAEGMGFVGEGSGMEARAVAMLRPRADGLADA